MTDRTRAVTEAESKGDNPDVASGDKPHAVPRSPRGQGTGRCKECGHAVKSHDEHGHCAACGRAKDVVEAKDSMMKATVHKKGLEKTPGKSDNWVERTGPGGKGGQLPAYIQHVSLAIEKSGKSRGMAIAFAIGTIKKWARGGGNVDANTRAAAAKALAEWEAMKAKNAAKKVAS